MKKEILGGLAAGAVALGLATASPAQASELVTICPDGHSGVARGQTSCPFAHNVRVGLLYQGGPIVVAPSPVTGDVYTMQCSPGFQIDLDNGMAVSAYRCVGGNNAVVWAW